MTAPPLDIEATALAKFDACVETGKIFYDDTTPEMFNDKGFQFAFLITPTLKIKPIQRRQDKNRTKAFEPFANPDPDGLIAEIGKDHWAILNKYCFCRPLLVVPTKEYTPQSDDLDLEDIDAGWSLLQTFETPFAVIYNCGTKAGSSVGHKHLQMFPLPEFPLWPSKATSETVVSAHIDFVPFKHFVLQLPANATSAVVRDAYQTLHKLSQQALKAAGGESRDYNVVFTKEWIAVIPRRTSGNVFGTNAYGMLGIVVLPDAFDRNTWAEYGYSKYLVELGLPLEDK